MLEKIGPELKYLERLFWKFRVSRFSFILKTQRKFIENKFEEKQSRLFLDLFEIS